MSPMAGGSLKFKVCSVNVRRANHFSSITSLVWRLAAKKFEVLNPTASKPPVAATCYSLPDRILFLVRLTMMATA